MIILCLLTINKQIQDMIFIYFLCTLENLSEIDSIFGDFRGLLY